ncbi:MAG: SH3 domain-containing protein [Anaerolineae bacterium]|nr:SH3 domain-containing protein [Anaerolineae bacterium]
MTAMKTRMSRRDLLKGGATAAVITGAALVGFDTLFGYRQVFGQDAGDDAMTIFNLAATAETLACTHYYNVLTDSSIALTPAEINYLKSAIDAELQHLEFLNANGGRTLATEFYFPQNVYTDREQFSQITERAEAAFVAAYLAAVRRISELGNPLVAAAAAQIVAVEQVHLALIRQIGGRVPNHVALAQALIYNVSDATPILQPFLEGGANFSGPKSFPTADMIREVIGDVGVLPVKPFTDPTLFGEAGAAATGDCTVTSGGDYNVNIRDGASINANIIDKLKPGATLMVTGQAGDADGFTWYQVESRGFVRSDVVAATGGCAAAPAVTG